MGAEEQDDAMGRLGGRSRISVLEEAVADLTRRLDEKTNALEQAVFGNKVTVGRELWPDHCSLSWFDQNGCVSYGNCGNCVIVAVGYDWCVVRPKTDTTNIYFAGQPGIDIRETIGPHVT
jgi:hypothetical protein